jgi:hypothetical protein
VIHTARSSKGFWICPRLSFIARQPERCCQI